MQPPSFSALSSSSRSGGSSRRLGIARLARVTAAVAATAAVIVVPLANCTSDTPTTPPAILSIGPQGGALASSDYVMEILVPAGALTTDVVFTITPVAAPSTGSVAPSYTITTDTPNLTFLQPAVVSFTEEVIASPVSPVFNDPSDYRVAAYEGSAWAPLANPSVDALADTIESTTTTLSTGAYSVVVPPATNCINVIVNQTCAAGDAGCTLPVCDPALPGKCAAYPGAIAESCTLNATSTVATTSCCVPATQQVCFLQAEPNGCNSPCSKYPGAVATSCIPNVGPPIENGPATPGAAASSTCCYPAGTSFTGIAGDAGADASSDASTETDAQTTPDSGEETGSDASADANVAADAGTDAGDQGTPDAGADASSNADAAADAGGEDAGDGGSDAG
jgi:hypothetical protein